MSDIFYPNRKRGLISGDVEHFSYHALIGAFTMMMVHVQQKQLAWDSTTRPNHTFNWLEITPKVVCQGHGLVVSWTFTGPGSASSKPCRCSSSQRHRPCKDLSTTCQELSRRALVHGWTGKIWNLAQDSGLAGWYSIAKVNITPISLWFVGFYRWYIYT